MARMSTVRSSGDTYKRVVLLTRPTLPVRNSVTPTFNFRMMWFLDLWRWVRYLIWFAFFCSSTFFVCLKTCVYNTSVGRCSDMMILPGEILLRRPSGFGVWLAELSTSSNQHERWARLNYTRYAMDPRCHGRRFRWRSIPLSTTTYHMFARLLVGLHLQRLMTRHASNIAWHPENHRRIRITEPSAILTTKHWRLWCRFFIGYPTISSQWLRGSSWR